MRTLHDGQRLVATPQVKRSIVEQGRVASWIASQIGITKFQMSHVLAGRRTVTEPQARIVAAILSQPVDVLFECLDEHNVEAA